MNLQLGKEKCYWLKGGCFFFFASVKPEILLGVCLFNLLFAVQNLGGKLQNVVWLQMCWCLTLGFFKEEKIVRSSPCALLAALPRPGVSLGYLPVFL